MPWIKVTKTTNIGDIDDLYTRVHCSLGEGVLMGREVGVLTMVPVSTYKVWVEGEGLSVKI